MDKLFEIRQIILYKEAKRNNKIEDESQLKRMFFSFNISNFWILN